MGVGRVMQASWARVFHLMTCADARGVLPAGADLKIGSQVVHGTHQMKFYEHIQGWACLQCGSIGTGGLVKHLAKPCSNHLLKAGKSNLDVLAKGKWPGDSAKAKAYNAARAKLSK